MPRENTRTRDDFVEAASLLFSERGFYGTSVADVASELDVSKQAVLHRFGSKEKLYGEVLQRTADELEQRLHTANSLSGSPEQRLLAVFLELGASDRAAAASVKLLMRELLDNPRRAEQAGIWYLKDFLDGLVDLVQQVSPWRSVERPRVLALIYQLLGAVNYHSISHATLRAMLGQRTYRALQQEFPRQLEATVRAALAAPPTP